MYVSHVRLAFFPLLHLPLKHDINSAMYVSHIRLAFFVRSLAPSTKA